MTKWTGILGGGAVGLTVAVAGYMGLTALGILAPDAPEDAPATLAAPEPANTGEPPLAEVKDEGVAPEVVAAEVVEDAPAPEVPEEATAEGVTPPRAAEEEVAEEVTPPEAPEEEIAEEATPSEAPGEKIAEEATPPDAAEEEVAEEVAPPQAPEEEIAEEVIPPEAPKEKIAAEVTPPDAAEEEVAEEATPPEATEEKIAEEASLPDAAEEEVAEEVAPPQAHEEEIAEVATPPEAPDEEIAEEVAPPEAPEKDLPREPASPELPEAEVVEETAPIETEVAEETRQPAPADPETNDTVARTEEAESTDPALEPEVIDNTEAHTIPKPTYDLVRIEPDGSALVAGEGAPRAEVTIYLDSAEIAETRTGTDGKFASLMDIPPSGQPRLMRLSMTVAGKRVFSDTEIIVAPFGPKPVAPVDDTADSAPPDRIAAVEPPVETAETPSEDRAPPAAPATPVEEQPATPAPEPAAPPASEREVDDAPRILAADEEGVRVLPGPEVLDRVAIDTISYDDAGDVALAGRGAGTQGGGFVRVYLDNTPITTSRIREDGSWRVTLPQVDKGVYVLRVDEVAEDGEVRSRAETPFQREDRETLEQASKEAEGGAVRIITVQPGNTLWQIARDRYGEGILYVRVFDANRGQIRDPDLIYPGQVFDLPTEQ